MDPERVGPYRVLRRLGRGGMGVVYEAEEQPGGQRVAVKLVAATAELDHGLRTRFEAEIHTLRKLNHPNIVRLLGFGEEAGQLYYAMELVEGESLESELARGRRFDWREVVQIAVQVCQALRHAHDRGIIHRDIKPSNLLLSPAGEVKLSDFGIARIFGQTRLTMPGNVVGTAEFMAPEQAEGQTAGPGADLYSLGAVMYVLLAGKPLFRARSLPEARRWLRRALRFRPLDARAISVAAKLAREEGTSSGSNSPSRWLRWCAICPNSSIGSSCNCCKRTRLSVRPRPRWFIGAWRPSSRNIF